MKVVILCGGKGSRLLEMTNVIPKPMISVGQTPLLYHIMDIYRGYGFVDFILPMGYKKEHILAYLMALNPEVMNSSMGVHFFQYPDFQVTAVDTGEDTMTGGRLLRIKDLVGDKPFHFTYGDGLSDVNLEQLYNLYLTHTSVATITVIHPEGRFGRAVVNEDNGFIDEFGEKTETFDWINGGFSVLSPDIFDWIKGDETNLEKDVYPKLAKQGFLLGYRHDGFWKCVDTRRDLLELEEIYNKKGAIWLKHS